jgi:hypothetical protein
MTFTHSVGQYYNRIKQYRYLLQVPFCVGNYLPDNRNTMAQSKL